MAFLKRTKNYISVKLQRLSGLTTSQRNCGFCFNERSIRCFHYSPLQAPDKKDLRLFGTHNLSVWNRSFSHHARILKNAGVKPMGHINENEDDKLSLTSLDTTIETALTACLSQQNADGHWRHNIEGSVYQPAEYILCMEYLGQNGPQINAKLNKQLGNYLRKQQLPGGGWAVEPESTEAHVSTSVMAYLALKVIGDQPSDEHMVKAREAIIQAGGLDSCNQFVRFHLALHSAIPWTKVLQMPVEIMLLPRWFPFHIYKISSTRMMLVPMMVIQALGKSVKTRVNVDEFCVEQKSSSAIQIKSLGKYRYQTRGWYIFFNAIDHILKLVRRTIPRRITEQAISEAVTFVIKRLNGLDGYGSISLSIQLALIMLHAVGYPADHPYCIMQRQALERLIVHEKDNTAYISSFFSPVWDTSLTAHAVMETDAPRALAAAKKGLDWLQSLQILNYKGDWAEGKPDLRPGGWAFVYFNQDYPDTDDTSVVVLAMDRYTKITKRQDFNHAISRGVEWIEGMQCQNGGWGAFDADNTSTYLNNIPLLEHQAVLDPPTADVTSRCVSLLTQDDSRFLTGSGSHARKQKALKFLLACQEPDGSWFGRWGVNYIYGTWSALIALNSAGVSHDHECIKKAVNWFIKIQNTDGGWGESCDSYRHENSGYVAAKSSPTQTSWALLGLLAAGVSQHPAVEYGIKYIIHTQDVNGEWNDQRYTALCLPNFMYYANHGYCKYFPLFALARYRRMKTKGLKRIEFGF